MDKAAIIHEAIKAHYLSQGRTLEQWQEVAKDPSKFNLVWRHALRIAKDTTPPPAPFCNVNPATGEILT